MPGLPALTAVVEPMAERFQAAGFRLFLVGGVVRDLVVAAELDDAGVPSDIDLTTDAHPADIKRLVGPVADALWTQGERFGTIGASLDGRVIEITTHRAESYDPESRNPVVSFGDDIADDLSRRDFTINAIAIELPQGELLDPHQGIGDLQRRVLQTPLSPEISFNDDPLRMLRAARFIPRFALTPAEGLVAAASELAPRLDIVSVERIADELDRLLVVPRPEDGLAFLRDVGLLGRVVPAIGGLPAADQDLAVSLAGAGAGAENPVVRRAGLLWPVRAQAEAELRRLRHSRATTRDTMAVLTGAEAASEDEPGPPLLRRLVARSGIGLVGSMAALLTNLASVGEIDHDRAAEFGAAFERLRHTEDLDDLGGPLTGAEVMELLGLEPGPEVGRALGHLRRLRLDQGPIGADEARRELLRWWRQDPGGGSSLT